MFLSDNVTGEYIFVRQVKKMLFYLSQTLHAVII
jgi:hypothetical protein